VRLAKKIRTQALFEEFDALCIVFENAEHHDARAIQRSLSGGNPMTAKCGTQLLINRKRLQARVPELFPRTDSARRELESFPIEVMSELHRLSPDDPLLRPYPKLVEALRLGAFADTTHQSASGD